MSKVLRGAGVLAICALIAKLIGASYRIPLTNIVGSEGIGLYQMIFPLYTVLLTVSSGGLPVAISKVVSERIAKGDEAGARKVLKVSLISLSLAGLLAGIAIVLLRNPIAAAQGNPAAAMGYIGIAPSLLLVAVIACFRGYYQGRQNMLPSAVSQLCEQIVKLAAGLYLARLFLPFGVGAAVFGALLGVSISELVTLLYLVCRYLFSTMDFKKRTRLNVAAGAGAEAAADTILPPAFPVQKTGAMLKDIYRVAIPVTLGSLVMPLTQVIDSVLVINLLTAAGTGRTAATGAYGLLTGPIGTIINMPVVISLSFAVALLPKVSECFFKNKDSGDAVGQSLKFNFIIGVFSACLLAVFSTPILSGLYAKGLSAAEIKTGAAILAVGSISVVYISILQVATAVLQGTNQAHKPAVNLLYGAVVKVLLTLALLPFFGLLGAMAASAACYGVTAVLDIYSMRKVSRPSLKIKEFFFGPVLAATGFMCAGIGLQKLLLPLLGNLWAALLAFAAATVVFIAILFIFRSVRLRELKEFLPFKRKRKTEQKV